LVETSVAFTFALGTNAPDGSLTVPLMDPRKVWAFAATTTVRRTNNTKSNRLMFSLRNNSFENNCCERRDCDDQKIAEWISGIAPMLLARRKPILEVERRTPDCLFATNPFSSGIHPFSWADTPADP
jgi:hypothetical protein